MSAFTSALAKRAVAARFAFVVGSAMCIVPSLSTAQEKHTVDGRVERPASKQTKDSTGMEPVANQLVTLHRVGKDAAGPVDSMRTRADGRYHFSWAPTGSAEAVYFASVTYAGIAYFTAPLKDPANVGTAAQIAVFDTSSTGTPIGVRGRHLVVSAVDSTNSRTVVEVFELSNDSLRTLVSSGAKSGAPTWSVAIPKDARDVRSSDGEISRDAFQHTDGRIAIFAPIAPGIKQISFSYHLPTSSFPKQFKLEQGATVLEVLIEEPQGQALGAKLASVAAVTLEGRKFRRFLAQDVPSDSVVVVDLPSHRTLGKSLYTAALIAAIGVAMLLVLLRVMQRRRPLGLEVPQVSRTVDVPLAERIAREIADLDAVYNKQTTPSDAVKRAYEDRRAELKDALGAELARARTG